MCGAADKLGARGGYHLRLGSFGRKKGFGKEGRELCARAAAGEGCNRGAQNGLHCLALKNTKAKVPPAGEGRREALSTDLAGEGE